MEYGYYRYDGGLVDIFFGDEQIGEIESAFEDINASTSSYGVTAVSWNPEYRVSAYTVTLYGGDLPEGLYEKVFEFDPMQNIARTVLAQAKEYVRGVVAEYLNV
tara:strand:+ start:408 stop:719 length:312 start_codon:yes stop_codon:yes gene_type:complete